MKNYDIINGEIFYDQQVDLDIKRHEEVKKLTSWQDEDCTTGCLLDFDYIKNYYKLIVVDMRKQKELDADHKAIQQREFVEQLKNVDGINTDLAESVFFLTNLEKN